ncbi:MAG: PorP/SprF family type IX secretion system membrane protein [Bacteroidales bacterium]|nr:PorP/SprF family type IX secretion system membrane protein [Bacteroidales bacterium]
MLIFLSFFGFSIAQDIHYSQFATSPTNLNPALTGMMNGYFRAGVNQKTQWLSATKPYLTFSASIDAPVYKNNRRREMVGIGVLLNVDRTGDSQFTSCQPVISASYIKSVDRENHHKIAVGAYAAIVTRSINYGKLTFDEQWINGYYSADNPITEELEKKKFTFFDWGLGTNYSFTPSEKFSLLAGVGLSHLNTPAQTFYKDEFSVLPIKTTCYIVPQISVHENVYLSPMFYATFQKNYTEILFGCTVDYQHRKNAYTNNLAFGGGLFYRWADAVIVMATVRWQNLKIGLSYDLNTSAFRPATHVRGGFEISLLYILKKATVKSAGREPCPFLLM